MNPELARAITNDWQHFKLLNLAKLAAAADFATVPGHGPFVILQEGSAPGDPHFRTLDFLLTRENTWLPVFAFVKMTVPERRALCLYPAVAEVMEQLESLTGPVILDARHTAEALGVTLPSDEFVEAIVNAKDSAQPIPR